MHSLPFLEEILADLRRFKECVEDGQDVDLGRDRFDLLTQLGLLERVQRSPARWMMTQAGEDAIAKPAAGHLVAVVGTVPDGSGFKSLDFNVELESLPDGTRLYAAAHGDEAVRWVSCSERLPDVANGGSQHFLVNVYRAHSGESSVFEAHFLRDYPLYNEALGDETGEYLATGWFNQVPDIEFDEYYEPVVRKESGDEVTHWMPMPAPAAMRAQGDGGAA